MTHVVLLFCLSAIIFWFGWTTYDTNYALLLMFGRVLLLLMQNEIIVIIFLFEHYLRCESRIPHSHLGNAHRSGAPSNYMHRRVTAAKKAPASATGPPKNLPTHLKLPSFVSCTPSASNHDDSHVHQDKLALLPLTAILLRTTPFWGHGRTPTPTLK